MSTLFNLIRSAKFSRSQERAATALHRKGVPGGAIQSLTDAGALSLSSYMTEVTTTTASAITLAPGKDGQLKMVRMIVDVGDATITPDFLNGGTTVVLSAVGDFVLFRMEGRSWTVVDMGNLLGTGATPVLA